MATTRERIIAAVEIDGNGCWRWQKSLFRTGYGRIGILTDGVWKAKLAHRVAFIEFKGQHAPGFELDHLCRVRDCVNPDHLEPVTHAENMRRSPLMGRKVGTRFTHCWRGHEFTPENTLTRKTGRTCKQCQQASWDRSAARKRALKQVA